MKRGETEDELSEELGKQAQESIDRIRWEFERLAEWIIEHRAPRERGSRDEGED